MRCLQKINQCGDSAHVAIPRSAMFWLGWLPGQAIILEILEDKSVRIRPVAEGDLVPKRPARIVLDNSFPAKV